jgi:hypothetical protein
MNPHVAMSYADALILEIARTYFTSRAWHWTEHQPGTDSYLGDPTIGVPDVWSYSGTGIETHHNSEDKPETVDPRSLRDLITTISTYLYLNATANESQADWLASITIAHVQDEMEASISQAIKGMKKGDASTGSYGLERVSYFSDCGERALLSILRLVPESRRPQIQMSLQRHIENLHAVRDLELKKLREQGAKANGAAQNPAAAAIVVRRKRVGTLPLDDLPQDQWEGYPSGAWDKRVTVALYWCDGKRNLAEVIRLAKMETGPSNFDFIGYFRFLERHGYVEFAH